ncbi:MAG: extracellular solute-binding protein [Ruminococcus sp.]|nr:extracellular solute-binding protein [Ruminococcus sp.]
MKEIRRTMAGITALTLMMSSVFSCSLSKKEESSEESVTEAQTTTEAPTEPEEEEEFQKADANDAMAITWLSDYDINPAKGEKRSSALEIFEDVFGGKVNFVYTSEDSKYDRLAEMINAGEEVDMFPYEKGAFPEGVLRDLYAPLDDYYEELGMDTGIWDNMQEVIEMFSYKGGHYVIPYSLTRPTILTYSRQVMREEGFQDPYELYCQGQWNWDVFMEMMESFVANGEGRYGINGEFGQAALASSGSTLIRNDGGQLVNNISDSNIGGAEQLLLNISQQGLYRSNWIEHFDTDANVLFYAMEDWALGESNALNEEKDLMIVPFPKNPNADRYCISCEHNARLLAKNSNKGGAVATYIRCERLAETEVSFMDERKAAATTVIYKGDGDTKSFITEEQYDALQELLDPTKCYPIFDFGYGMGKAMYDHNGAGIMFDMENTLLNGYYGEWDYAKEAWSPVVDGELERFKLPSA